MNKLEEEYKGRFKDLGSLEGIDPDQLWGSISGKMGDSPTETILVKNYRQTIKWSALLLLILLLGGLLCYNFKTPKSQNTNKASLPIETQKTSNDPLPYAENKIDPTNLKKESTLVENKNNQTQNNRLRQENPPTTTPDLSSNSLPQPRPKTTNDENIFNTKTNQNQDLSINKKPIADVNIPTTLIDTLTTIDQENSDPFFNKKNQITTNLEPIIKTSLPTTSSIPTLGFFIENNYYKKLNLPLVKDKKIIKPKTSSYFEIAAYTGVNTLFLDYKKGNSDGSLLNELSNSNSSQIGWSNAFRISWISNEKFSITSGIDHDLIRLKFSAIKETETTVTDNNYLVKFGIDPQSGDTINQEYVTRDRDALLKRRVVHHNRFNLISIPLEFGFQKQKGKLGYGIKLGASASFFINQKGKTFNQAKDIYIIDNTIKEQLPFKKFFIAYQLNPFVDYSLSKKLKVRLSPVFKYQAFGKSSLYGLDQSAMFIGLNGGLVIKMSE